jgi:hypothetical protein
MIDGFGTPGEAFALYFAALLVPLNERAPILRRTTLR